MYCTTLGMFDSLFWSIVVLRLINLYINCQDLSAAVLSARIWPSFCENSSKIKLSIN